MPTQGVGRHPHADNELVLPSAAKGCRPTDSVDLWALPEPAVRAVEADDGVQTAEISSPIPMPIHISKMLIFAYDWIFFLQGQCC